MMRSKTIGFFTVTALALMACVSSGKGLTNEDREQLKQLTIESVPGSVGRLDVNFENKVHLVGFKTDPDVAKPGSEVKLTFYWRLDDTLEDGWRIFTHVEDEFEDRKIGNLDESGSLRTVRDRIPVYPLDKWERGKILVDEVTYHVPDDVKGANINFLAGVWREKGNARLRVVTGPNDGDNRAIAGKLKTGLTPPDKAEKHGALDLPQLILGRVPAGESVAVDGNGNDKAWGVAASTGPFVDVGTGSPNAAFPVNGSAKLLFDDKNLYALIDVNSTEFYTGFSDAKAQPKDFTAAGQPKLWTKDTVELMIDPAGDGDNRDYFEIQINPQNKVFKSHFESLQQPNGGDNGPFGHEDWDPGMKSAVTIKKNDGKPSGYVVEVSLPWSAFAKGRGGVTDAPKPGEVWRVNFYAMKNNGGTAWSAIKGLGNFHFAPRFGKLQFGTPTPTPAASAAAAPSASASARPRGPRGLIPPHQPPGLHPDIPH